MHLNSTWSLKFWITSRLRIYPIGIKCGRLTSDIYATNERKQIFDSDNVFKKFETLDGRSEALHSQNDNA